MRFSLLDVLQSNRKYVLTFSSRCPFLCYWFMITYCPWNSFLSLEREPEGSVYIATKKKARHRYSVNYQCNGVVSWLILGGKGQILRLRSSEFFANRCRELNSAWCTSPIKNETIGAIIFSLATPHPTPENYEVHVLWLCGGPSSMLFGSCSYTQYLCLNV